MKITINDLAAKYGVTPRCLRNYPEIRAAFKLDEPSQEKLKPWESLKISRATYFRHKKNGTLKLCSGTTEQS